MNPMQQEIVQVQQSFWNALRARDTEQLNRLLADEFVSVGRANQGKAEFIERLVSFPAEVLGIEGDGMQVHLFDDIAVLTTVQIAHVRLPQGDEMMETLVTTNIFRHETDGWHMVLAHPVSAGSED